MSKERRVYNPATAAPWTPAKEWVTLADGSEVCVWELSVAENFDVMEASMRHPEDPRPGGNEKEAAMWLLVYACRRGDAPGSLRVWDDREVFRVLELAPTDFTKLLIAARGLVEGSPEAEKQREDFTPPLSESRRPASASGASSTSIASPASLSPSG